MKGFLDFIRQQGVVGLAVGLMLGGAIQKFVSALIQDIINPLLGLIMGKAEGLQSAVVEIGSAQLQVGNFFSASIDFVVIAMVIYFGVMRLGLSKLDKPKKA